MGRLEFRRPSKELPLWTPPPSAIASPTSSKSIRPFRPSKRPTSSSSRRAGRVRFHEANEYILWQGEPHKPHVFVIQQGTVSLWDEADGQAVLKDVRGPGDMLGIERFNGAPCCLHSARSASDVVIYSFPASDFEELVLKYPYARRFVEAHDTVTRRLSNGRRTCALRKTCSCTTSWAERRWRAAARTRAFATSPHRCSPPGPTRSPSLTRAIASRPW